MSYTPKYRLQFTNTNDDTYVIDVEQKDYTGTVEERDHAGAFHPVLKKDISDHVMGTSLDFGIEVKSTESFGISDLYTEDPRGIRVSVFKGGFSGKSELGVYDTANITSGQQFKMFFWDGSYSQWYTFEFTSTTPLPTPPTGVDYMLPTTASSNWVLLDVIEALQDIQELSLYDIAVINDGTYDRGFSVTAKSSGSLYNLEFDALAADLSGVVENYEPFWQGFLVPEQYTDPYVYPKFDIQLMAVDGIGLLKNIDFDMTGVQSELDILQDILSKTGISLSLAVAINIWETSMLTTRSPIAQSYLDTAMFYDDQGKPMNCYDAMLLILGSYGLPNEVYISRGFGYWVLFRTLDMQGNFMVYDTDGDYDTTISGFSISSFGSQTNKNTWPVGYMSRQFRKRIHQYTLQQDLLTRDNMFYYGTFKEADFDDVVAGEYIKRAKYWSSTTDDLSMATVNGQLCMFCERTSNPGAYIVSDSLAFVTTTEDVEFYFKIMPRHQGYTTGSFRVRIMMGLNYLASDGTWSTTVTTLTTTGLELNKEAEIIHKASSLPADGNVVIQIQGTDAVDWFNLLEASMRFDDILQMPKRIDYMSKLTDYVNTKVEEPFIGDIPSDNDNLINLYKGVKQLSDGSPTYNWRHQSDSSNYRLATILMRTAASNNRDVCQMLLGTITGASLTLHTIIQHALNSNRKFYTKAASLDLWRNELDGEFEELLSYSEQTFDINKTEYFT